MKHTLTLALAVVLVCPAAAFGQWTCQGQQNASNCPPCYRNQTVRVPTQGGLFGDGSGRHVVNVYVQGAPNQGFRSGIDEGRERWNRATDTSSNPGTISRPPFYFANTNDPSEADVIVVFDTTVPGAQYQSGHNPPRIAINPNNSAFAGGSDFDVIAGTMAHELGHDRGLGNAYMPGSGCSQADTVMRGASHLTVHERDVFQMNRAFRNQGQCCADAANDPGTNFPGCPDYDGDGWTSCDNDCNDFDPMLTYDCSGGDGCDQQAVTDCINMWTWSWDYTTCTCFCDPGLGCDTPVVLNVLGDGFDLTDAAGGVNFDLNRDGVGERLSWTAPGSDDAWLALDRNDNGRVDDGGELFGNYTPQPPSKQPNGFLALAEYDRPEHGGNSDGALDALDAAFASLLLWRDADHDGVSGPGELLPLPASDVVRLHLDFKESKRVDEHGNRFKYRAKVDDAKGAKVNRWAWDVFLVKAP